jgi:serine protease AprX
MKKLYFAFCFLFIFSPFGSLWAQPELTPSLLEAISQKTAEDFISVNIRLVEQYDGELLTNASQSLKTSAERRSYAVSELKSFSQTSQAPLLELLATLEAQGKVKQIQPLWIGNLVNCMVLPEVVEILAARADLARLDYNKMQQVLEVSDGLEVFYETKNDKLKNTVNIAWNVTLINAPQVWQEGFTGEEVVVSVIDSGVNYNHQDLAGRMWTHPDFPNHGFNFLNNSHSTMDDNSHGTHCAGTVAGNGTAGTITGIAPGASIMALKVLDGSGSGTEAGVWAAIQFSVEHGASVMSLSLGWKHAWNPDRSMWRTTMDNALAAGVIAAVAAGNEGTSFSDTPPSQVRTPGDIPPPWTNPLQLSPGGNSAVVSVGSTTNTDAISSFSSRGPVTWQAIAPFNDYPHNPGIGLIRPDVVAPGSNITSLTHNSNTGYTAKSGTSMATPAVAGLMALMISKNPNLTPLEISQILEETALSLAPGKGNTFGSGRVNSQAALEATPFMGIRYVSHTIDDTQGNADGLLNPGELAGISLTLENPTEEDIEGVQARLLLESSFAVMVENTAFLGDFLAGEVRTFENIFSFEASEDMPGTYKLNFTLEAFQDEEETIWRSRFEETGFAPNLNVAGLTVNDEQGGNGNGRLDPGETAILMFKIENSGQIDSDLISVALSAQDPLISISNTQVNAEALDAGSHFFAQFEVSVHASMAPGTTTAFEFELTSGPYQIQKYFYQKVGLIIEDWEAGNFDQFEWEFDGNAPWVIVSDQAYEGTYSAKSGSIGHSASTSIFMTLDVVANDSISFYRKVSSENNYDWLEFYIDGVRVDRWSGERPWEKFSYPVQEGMRTLRWVYAKDFTVSSGQDAAWIDNIIMPATIRTLAYAGLDMEQCGGQPVELAGFASQYESLEWQTSGDGTFDDPNLAETVYTPGQQDLVNGQATLTLLAYRSNEVKAQHSLVLTLMPEPEIDLGEDITLCLDHVTLLNPGAGFQTYLWSNGSQQNRLWVTNPEFGPESEIWIEVTNKHGCAARDTVVVTFDACLNAGSLKMPENDLLIFPNPATQRVNIAFNNPNGSDATISLIDQRGLTIKSERIMEISGDVKHELDISGLRPGIYLIVIESNKARLVKRLAIY